MKLRHRLALAFALSTSLMLVVARTLVSLTFLHVQRREFDDLLVARARLEAHDVSLLGRQALERAPGRRRRDGLEHVMTYVALYREDGSLLYHPTTFSPAPALRELGAWRDGKLTYEAFDFESRDTSLRGVVAEVDAGAEPDARFLLIAASRHEIDADARQLRDLGIVVLIGASALSMLVGWWLGKRMTRGVEAIAEAAHRVTEGDLDVRVAPALVRDAEVSALAVALTQMVDHLKALIENERRFASNAAHELRSPLTALRGELELALRRPRTLVEYEGALRGALDDANRLIALSEDLLVLARATLGRADGRQGRVAVGTLVEDALGASLARGEAQPRVEVELGDAADVEVVGEPNELVRVVRNLVDNAIAHAPAGRCVRLRARAHAGEVGEPGVRIEIEDDGGGVANELRERIFEPFVRGDAEREHSGAGLGLAIAREVTRRYGGDVTLESASAPTRFVVRLRATLPNMKSLNVKSS